MSEERKQILPQDKCEILEKVLTEDPEPRKAAAYLCLHMGLSLSEVSGLRLCDIDLDKLTLTVRSSLARTSSKDFDIQPADAERTLPLPRHVAAFLRKNLSMYPSPDCYIVSGSTQEPKIHYLQNLLFSINSKYGLTDRLTVNVLRDVFVHRCFECGLDLYTVGKILGLKQLGALQARFADELPYSPQKLELLERFVSGHELSPIADTPRRMNLLILGAGSQGPVVRETALALGVFNQIAYLDDDPENPLAIDSCANYKKYVDLYPIAIPSFGDCVLRAKWIDRLEEAGFILPTLIHPMATVSPSAVIEEGTIVEMKAIVGTNARICRGCILSSGAVVDLNTTIGKNTHIGSAATIRKGSVVPPFSVVQSGEVF